MSEYGGFTTEEPSPQEVNRFHRNSDCDSSVFAQHHTLGTKATQAAAGDHTHDDLVTLIAGLEARISALESP